MSVEVKEEKNERRKSVRYDVTGIIEVTAYLYEGKVFYLHTPQKAELINISKGGVRLRMKPNSLSIDDMIQICLQIGAKQRILSANVVNLNNNEESTEYGCELMLG